MAALTRFTPRLAGQDADYTAMQWADLSRACARTRSWPAWPRRFRRRIMKDIGAHYASLKPTAGAATGADLARLGEKFYRGGNAKTGVSACMSCHGSRGHGIPPRLPTGLGPEHGLYREADARLQIRRAHQRRHYHDAHRVSCMSEHEIKVAVADYMAVASFCRRR